MKILISLIVLSFTLIACSSSPSKMDKKINQEVAAETPTTHKGELAARGFEIFEQAPNLTPEQKTKLIALHKRMAQEMGAIQDETSQLKTVLFRTLVSPNYDEKE